MCECTTRDLTDVWVHLSSYDWCLSAPLELWLMCECTARTMTKCVSAPLELWLMCERTTKAVTKCVSAPLEIWLMCERTNSASYDWCLSVTLELWLMFERTILPKNCRHLHGFQCPWCTLLRINDHFFRQHAKKAQMIHAHTHSLACIYTLHLKNLRGDW